MRFTTDEIATITGGQRHGDSETVEDATIDSRSVQPGQLFVPVVAERDGHDFIDHALEAGAAAYLTERDDPGVGPAVVVESTEEALAALGMAARQRISGPVVGITGSVGKTSTKDMIAAIFAETGRPFAASVRNFNNELGVPLTLVNSPNGAELAVIEMGARGPGHIRELCIVAQPTIGVVTRVAAVHTSEFAGLDEIAATKGELVESLPESGTAILNADDGRVIKMATRTSATVVTYGRHGDWRAEHVELGDDLRARLRLVGPLGAVEVRLGVAGRHQADNAVGAAATAAAAGCSLEEIAAGLSGAALSPGRMQVHHLPGGGIVIDDTYNASPTSMIAALDALAAVPGRRHVAVLGPMAELGDLEEEGHAEVAAAAAERDVEVIAVGDAYGSASHRADSVAEAVDLVPPLDGSVAVLVKASRSAGLERVVAALLAR